MPSSLIIETAAKIARQPTRISCCGNSAGLATQSMSRKRRNAMIPTAATATNRLPLLKPRREPHRLHRHLANSHALKILRSVGTGAVQFGH